MRFSIRWALGVTAYMALVAAAVGARSDLLAGIVWAVSYIAVCYAAVVACIAIEWRRAISIGFVILAVGNVVCLYLAPHRQPSTAIFVALDFRGSTAGRLYARDFPPYVVTPSGAGIRRTVPGSEAIVDAVNAVETLLAGLIGCGIGALAYRHSCEHDT